MTVILHGNNNTMQDCSRMRWPVNYTSSILVPLSLNIDRLEEADATIKEIVLGVVQLSIKKTFLRGTRWSSRPSAVPFLRDELSVLLGMKYQRFVSTQNDIV